VAIQGVPSRGAAETKASRLPQERTSEPERGSGFAQGVARSLVADRKRAGRRERRVGVLAVSPPSAP